jgi:hypothetical protein
MSASLSTTARFAPSMTLRAINASRTALSTRTQTRSCRMARSWASWFGAVELVARAALTGKTSSRLRPHT